MDEPKPWCDAPPCRECAAAVATPSCFSPHSSTFAAPDKLWCPSCGAFWHETDLRVIAKAWWSRGAWEGRQATQDEVPHG